MHYILSTKEILDDDFEEIDFFTLAPLSEEECEWPWLRGMKIDRDPSLSIDFKVDPDEDAGAFADFIAGPIPLVTTRFKQALISSGVSNIDFYPVKIEGSNNFENFPAYFAMNIVGLVSAADPANTISTRSFGMSGADLIDKFSISEQAARGLKIFRLAEHFSTVVVDDTVKSACEAADLITLKFIAADTWSN